jgi:UDP-N-acetylglucosamine 1-carboxyvinyltransferase
MGAVVEWDQAGRELVVHNQGIKKLEAPYDLVSTMRASVLVLGPLLTHYGQAKVSLPGGCAIGARPIDQHLKGLRLMGAQIELTEGYIYARAKKLRGTSIYLDIPTVTGTENLMLAACLASGTTIIENAACEPEVVELAQALINCGAKISGAGTSFIEIQGVNQLNPIEHYIGPDRIEAGTFAIATAITRGEVEIIDCIPECLISLIDKLKEAGVKVEIKENSLWVQGPAQIKPVNIETRPYPGFPTDLQAQFMALMTLAEGSSIITENVFENRFMHVAELRRMGADIEIHGHSALVKGVKILKGAPLMATDLRASAALIIAGLRAKGKTTIHRVYHLDRGYEQIEEKLSLLGAQIKRIS